MTKRIPSVSDLGKHFPRKWLLEQTLKYDYSGIQKMFYLNIHSYYNMVQYRYNFRYIMHPVIFSYKKIKIIKVLEVRLLRKHLLREHGKGLGGSK